MARTLDLTALSKCALWKEPRRTTERPLKVGFELISTPVKDSHWWQYVLRCRDCGQIYLMEFFEEIDWEHGRDSPIHHLDTSECNRRCRAD